MERFKFKTRGMRSPQGIPRVFFCCHPKDFDRFFESVSDEILGKQNCAVFYDSTPDAERDEQFYLDLKQMQLFVMPVTSELLYTANTALSELFPFAIENHIPVLPIMQESGLDKVFNEKCGDLQYLDKTSTDITAISYDEKLEKYLSSVLIGDEMAEKIRNAFDAYVFLSYRKKDRKYAQELMKLIHKNDFCRDIAIWYDEFLTPGENFNDSIKAAFEKSGLFVLAVTPNLVNEVNYVMTTEYPMAREAGKPILPAELVETDKSLLAEKYEGIPDCTDAYNDAELSAALLDSIKRIAIKANDNSPEHNFFIGLAYLGGVDVEADHEKALELITFAAEKGLVEAIEKLVEMYRTGYGVKRDYLKAIEWQEKLIETTNEKYIEEPSEEIQNKLFWVIIDCGDYYKELAKLSKAKEKYEQAMRQFDSVDFDELTNRQKRSYSVCCNRVGDINKAEGNLKGARGYYEKMFEINLLLAEETGTVEAKRDLSISYDRLGNICKAEGNLKGARGYYEKMFEINLLLAEETETVEAKRDLSTSYNRLGDICKAEGDINGAKEYYEKSLELRALLANETETVEAKRNLSISYSLLGDICKAEGDLKGAKEYYEKSLELRALLANETETVEAKRNLSISYSLLGDICKAEGDLKGAKEYYEKSLELRTMLADETGTVQAKQDLSASYVGLGDICYERLSDICKAKDYLKRAKGFYEKAFEIDLLLAEETGTVQAKRDLSISYDRLGDICVAEGDLNGAKEYYGKSLEIRIMLADEAGTVEAKRDLSISYNKLGNICKAEGDLSGAREYYEKAFEIAFQLAEETGTVEAKRILSISYDHLGDICVADGDLKGARKYYEKSLEIRIILVEEKGSLTSYNDLAISYNRLSICDEKRRLEYLKKSIEIYELLVSKAPKVVCYRKALDKLNRRYGATILSNLGIEQHLPPLPPRKK